jgi:two-component system chemotaxis response regulator CheB
MIDAAESATDRPRGPAIVVAGASAGGVEALVRLIGTFPPDFPYPVLVVLHVSPTGTSVLPAILDRAGPLQVSAPADGDRLRRGHVYVAPPDVHLVVEGSRVHLSQAPRENGHRPAIDPTMRSAAHAYAGSTIGIVLSGSRDDGTAGLIAIKDHGGIAIVQDPDEAMYDAMPRSALDHVDVDAVLPIADMVPWILEDARVRAAESDPPMTVRDPDEHGVPSASGEGTRFTCPDCGGVLFERQEGALERFQCSVGHVFSIESLSSAQAEALEGALWAAVRSLEDRTVLLSRMAERARRSDDLRRARDYDRQGDDALERARTIRQAIENVSAERALAVES